MCVYVCMHVYFKFNILMWKLTLVFVLYLFLVLQCQLSDSEITLHISTSRWTYLHNETSVFSKYCDVKQHERATLQHMLKTNTDTLRMFLKNFSVIFLQLKTIDTKDTHIMRYVRNVKDMHLRRKTCEFRPNIRRKTMRNRHISERVENVKQMHRGVFAT